MASGEGRGPRPSGGGYSGEAKELWPRDFGRDGASGMVTLDRAMRARDVSQPTVEDELEAASVVESLLARIDGRRARSAAR
jgi:hypothetical protein